MKNLLFFTISLFISATVYSQSIITSKSGQVINITNEGVIESTNLEELVVNESFKPEIRDIMRYLLGKDQKNRISSFLLNKEISLLEVDAKVKKSSEISANIKSKKVKLKEIEKEYDVIIDAVKGLRKRDKTTIAKLTKEMNESRDTDNVAQIIPPSTSEESSIPQTEGTDQKTVEVVEEKMDEPGEVELKKDTSEVAEKQKLKKEKNPKKEKKAKGQRVNNNQKQSKEILVTPQNKIILTKVVECDQFAITNKNNFTTQYSVLTQYTPSKLENYFKQESFLTMSASLKVSDVEEILKVKCDFIPKDISKSYGAVAINDFLRIQFINGKHIFLKAVSVQGPQIEKYSGHSIFEFEYKFESKDDFEKLKESLLDSVGIMWSTGFEDYQIYNIDFFQTMLKDLDTCRKSKLH